MGKVGAECHRSGPLEKSEDAGVGRWGGGCRVGRIGTKCYDFRFDERWELDDDGVVLEVGEIGTGGR